ncbi:AraC family transcriptional regulator [Psychrosphaera haliotis]|uniref:AraC family transcriptional regulator n=2 Tax=Psychrosphaera haliotis TaxID=555083 RepID=A0A6N8F8F7_9GAMM|nr:AraC family transcriptional regulator [Psychrosphaera haliotis]
MDYLGINNHFCTSMSITSNWPLPKSSVRFLVPRPMIKELQVSAISRGLCPLAFGFYERAIGHEIKRTNHDDHLVLCCVDGHGKVIVGNKVYNMSKNDIIFLPKGVAHHYKASKKEPWSIYWAHVDGHMFEEFMDIIGVDKLSLKITLTEPKIVIDEFKQLIESRHLGYQLNRFFVASNMLKKIFSLITLQRPIISLANNRNLSERSIQTYFNDNIDQPLTLDDMAKYFGLSKFYFAKKFQQIIGNSPIKHLIELKIQQACKLLDSTDISINHVAKSVGLDDPYYFSRLFKKTIGISPSNYRKSRHGH